MAGCDLRNHPRACSIAQTRYRRPECTGCATGEKNLKAEATKAEMPVSNVLQTTTNGIGERQLGPNEKNDHHGKEERVDKEMLGKSILRVLGQKGAMSVSALKNFAARTATKEEFRSAVDELARMGKVNTKAGAREGSLKVWLADTSEPGTAAAKKAATPRVASKRRRNVNQRQTDISAIAPSQAPGKIPPKNGGGRTNIADLDRLGSLQQQVAQLTRQLAAQASVDRELTDIIGLSAGWLHERMATA